MAIFQVFDNQSRYFPPTIKDLTVYKGLKEMLQITGYALDAPDPVL